MAAAAVTSTDTIHMARALALAERGRGLTSPNPMVGAVVVDDEGVVVGRGSHRAAGEPHAEILAFADAGNARQQALRGTYDPGYLAYTLGKLMIRKLRSDWLAANPGATPRRFHDEFLSFGSPPLPLVRKQMLGSAAGAL